MAQNGGVSPDFRGEELWYMYSSEDVKQEDLKLRFTGKILYLILFYEKIGQAGTNYTVLMMKEEI